MSSSRASTSQWSLGLARPCRARCFVCVGVCLLVCFQVSCVCQSVRPPACAGSTVRSLGESPCLYTSKEGGSRCHWFFPGCCKEVAIVFFLRMCLNSGRLQMTPPLTLCFPTVPTDRGHKMQHLAGDLSVFCFHGFGRFASICCCQKEKQTPGLG